MAVKPRNLIKVASSLVALVFLTGTFGITVAGGNTAMYWESGTITATRSVVHWSTPATPACPLPLHSL
jgi:hypothetical protein